jgi:hypothetical protein
MFRIFIKDGTELSSVYAMDCPSGETAKTLAQNNNGFDLPGISNVKRTGSFNSETGDALNLKIAKIITAKRSKAKTAATILFILM